MSEQRRRVFQGSGHFLYVRRLSWFFHFQNVVDTFLSHGAQTCHILGLRRAGGEVGILSNERKML